MSSGDDKSGSSARQGKGKVAPHLNCEVRLVLGGNKPLATIEKVKDPYGYALAIALSGTGALYLEQVACGVGEVVFTAPKNRHLVQEWRDLLHSGVKDHGLKGYHYRMGRLYGYAEEDIRAFVESEIDCNCNKCRGM